MSRRSNTVGAAAGMELREGENNGHAELKLLVFLTLALGILEIIVIYQKYDFLNVIEVIVS